MSPLDFTTDELEQLFDLAADIEKILRNTHTSVTERSLQPAFMSQVPERV